MPESVGDSDQRIDVLVTHPEWGSVWLDNAHIEGDYVIGTAWDASGVGSPFMPPDYSGEPVTMNFPITCIRKKVPRAR